MWIPKAEATGLAPEKSAETLCWRPIPLAEGVAFWPLTLNWILTLCISLVEFQSGGLGSIKRDDRRAYLARRSE